MTFALEGRCSIHLSYGDRKAEVVGFEPTEPFRVHWFSRPARSTALPHFLIAILIILFNDKLVKREYDLTNSMILIVSRHFHCLMFQQMQII